MYVSDSLCEKVQQGFIVSPLCSETTKPYIVIFMLLLDYFTSTASTVEADVVAEASSRP